MQNAALLIIFGIKRSFQLIRMHVFFCSRQSRWWFDFHFNSTFQSFKVTYSSKIQENFKQWASSDIMLCFLNSKTFHPFPSRDLMMPWQQEMEHIWSLLSVGCLCCIISGILIHHQGNHITRECYYDVLCSWQTVTLKLVVLVFSQQLVEVD